MENMQTNSLENMALIGKLISVRWFWFEEWHGIGSDQTVDLDMEEHKYLAKKDPMFTHIRRVLIRRENNTSAVILLPRNFLISSGYVSANRQVQKRRNRFARHAFL